MIFPANEQFGQVIKKAMRHINADEDQKVINKEIIRRLRIQNKKLIEQITKLKEENKRAKEKRMKIINHINELIGLI